MTEPRSFIWRSLEGGIIAVLLRMVAAVLRVLADGVDDKENARKGGENNAGVNLFAAVELLDYASVWKSR